MASVAGEANNECIIKEIISPFILTVNLNERLYPCRNFVLWWTRNYSFDSECILLLVCRSSLPAIACSLGWRRVVTTVLAVFASLRATQHLFQLFYMA